MRKINLNIKWQFNPTIQKITTVILSVIFVALVIFVLILGPRPYRGGLQEGDVARETIRAPFDFFVKGDINKEATETKREEAAKAIKDVYDINNKKLEESLKLVNSFFDNLAEINANSQLNQQQKIQALKEKKTGIKLDKNTLAYLINLDAAKETKIKEIVEEITKDIMSKAIMANDEKKQLSQKVEKIVIRNEKIGTENEVSVKSIWNEEDARNYLHNLVDKKVKSDKKLKNVIVELTIPLISKNLPFNKKITQKRKWEAKEKVQPVYKKIKIKQNNIIVAKSQLVTKEHTRFLKRLQELQYKRENKASKMYYYIGISLFVIILYILFWIYLKLYQPKIISSTRYLLLIGLLSAIIIILSKAISTSFLSSYLIPLASISMLIAILLNARVAIVTTVFLAAFIGIITGEQLGTFLYSLSGGMIAIYSVIKVRRRSQLLQAGLLVGVVNSISVTGIDLLHNLEIQAVLKDSLWAISNGFICAFIATGILPILEYVFKITTDISLLELSDLNHPLLKEMVIKAPGTYHHSLIVGNLAENAADAIGANPLLARIGGYYHDIGKLVKPEYFNENQMGFSDKHAELSPKMSSLIITNHVKEGLELAKKYRLSEVIKDFIAQHHGTSLTYYFYQRALEKENGKDQVKEEEFRYPGPLPQNKETAIVLLADSVEAATRAISEPNAAKIERTVQKIINNKFIDGQLNECDLTLKDLHKISKSFSNLLMGIYHSRIEYPERKQE